MVQLLFILGVTALLGAVDVQMVILLGPLACQDRSLQELLAGVFLEEGFVGDRAVEIINHQLEDGVDLLFGVTGVVSESGIL